MNKEFLEEQGLSAEQVKAVLSEYKSSSSKALEGYVPLERLNNVIAKRDEYKEKAIELQKLIDNEDTEQLRNSIKNLTLDLQSKESELTKVKIQGAVNNYVNTLDNKPINIEDLNLDFTDVTEDNLEEKIKPQIEESFKSKPYLFKTGETGNVIEGLDNFTNFLLGDSGNKDKGDDALAGLLGESIADLNKAPKHDFFKNK